MSWRTPVTKTFVLSAAVIGLLALLASRPAAQGRGGGGPQSVVVGQLGGKPVVQVAVRGVDYRDAISITDAAMNGPGLRLAGGHRHRRGRWEGGGSEKATGVAVGVNT